MRAIMCHAKPKPLPSPLQERAAVKILDEQGITESSLWVMNSIIQATTPDHVGSLDGGDLVTETPWLMKSTRIQPLRYRS